MYLFLNPIIIARPAKQHISGWYRPIITHQPHMLPTTHSMGISAWLQLYKNSLLNMHTINWHVMFIFINCSLIPVMYPTALPTTVKELGAPHPWGIKGFFFFFFITFDYTCSFSHCLVRFTWSRMSMITFIWHVNGKKKHFGSFSPKLKFKKLFQVEQYMQCSPLFAGWLWSHVTSVESTGQGDKQTVYPDHSVAC